MTAIQNAVLELDADVDQDGTIENGVFELVGDLEVNQRTVVDHLLSREFGNLNSVVTGLPGWAENLGIEGAAEVQKSRVGYYVDLGAGAHIFEINALGWESPDYEYQWGDPAAPEGSYANATAEDPYTQMQTLNEYLRQGEFDSREERARLRVGEYSGGSSPDGSISYPDGKFDEYLHVTIKHFNFNRNARNPKSFDVSMTLEETEDLTGPLDILTQAEY